MLSSPFLYYVDNRFLCIFCLLLGCGKIMRRNRKRIGPGIRMVCGVCGKWFGMQKKAWQFIDWCSAEFYGSFLRNLMDLDWFWCFFLFNLPIVSETTEVELINSVFVCWLKRSEVIRWLYENCVRSEKKSKIRLEMGQTWIFKWLFQTTKSTVKTLSCDFLLGWTNRKYVLA